jgi:hypothetical protein
MCIKRSLSGTIVFISIMFCSISEASVYLWPVIIKGRGERNEQQNLELKSNSWPTFGASYSFERWMVSLDSSKYSKDSDSGNVSISTEYSDAAVWGGYSLFQGDIWDFYGVAGFGFYQEKIKTTITSLSTTNNTSNRNLLGFGIEHIVRTPFGFTAATGARLDWTEDLDPEIMPEIYLKLGFVF